MIPRIVFVFASIASALVPLTEPAMHEQSIEVPPWPQRFDHRFLIPRAATPNDAAFARLFPGRIAQFTDGQREFIFRWVTAATRKVHPAADCFRGLGYTITPLGEQTDIDGASWNYFAATRGTAHLRVRERISAADGKAWTDVSAWFWAALFQRTRGPWFSAVVVETDSMVAF